MDILTFIIFSLATWRQANLLTDENQRGPFQILERIRKFADRISFKNHGNNVFYRFGLPELVRCEYCCSMWFAGTWILLYWLNNQVAFYLALPFALSAMCILIKYIHQTLRNADEYLYAIKERIGKE